MPKKERVLTPSWQEIFLLFIKSIKWDYKALEKSYDKRKKEPRVQVYYAHPYRSGERGSNENANRLIRRFIPKGTVITDISEEFIQQVEDWINNLLRPMFGFKSSLEMAKIVS